MKLAMANLYFLPVQGGIETYMYELSKRFVPEHEVEIIAGGVKGIKRHRIVEGISEYRIPFVRPNRATAWLTITGMYVPSCALRIANTDYDIVHANCVPSAFAATRAGRNKKPFVFTQHNNMQIVKTYIHWFGSKVYDSLMNVILDSAAGIISVSKCVASEMEARYGVKSKVIYNGVDLEGFSPMVDGSPFRKALGLGDAPMILLVCKFDKRKGLEHLAEAFAHVQKTIPDSRLVIVGKSRFESDNYLYSVQRRMRRLGVRDKVYFTGELPLIWLQKAYAACNVFVLPSETETFGIVVAEASSSGKPVVVTRSGGPEEIVEDGKTGYVVEPCDHEAMAERVIRLLSDEKLSKKMGESGRRRAETHFNWDVTAKETMKVYARALS